jgi:flagellar basal-body rod modification protein FlgD
MSSIIAAIANASAAPAANPNSTTGATGSSSALNKDMFLQLLVAQLKNQDPLNPTDGTQFVTQLAQFQQLEQSVNTGQDITAIRTDLDQLLTNSSTTNSKT